ncbi:MAG: putative neutral ceramidase superfamily lipid hydrolase [Ancylomarina sp.]|jgi:predicted neutral ceramidase superfamily lipid hydrolase
MFFILGICIVLFLEFLLLIRKNKSRADKVLAIWLLLMVVHQALFYHQITGRTFEIPHLLAVLMPLPILHGVMLYFYVLEVTGKSAIKLGVRLLDFVPLFYDCGFSSKSTFNKHFKSYTQKQHQITSKNKSLLIKNIHIQACKLAPLIHTHYIRRVVYKK